MSHYTLVPLSGYAAPVGSALAAMVDSRQRTLDAIAQLADEQVDTIALGLDNTVGATLYHIAAIEADWLYYDLLEEDYPAWMGELFPFEVREENGRLSPAPGSTVAQHIDRLAAVRAHFLQDIKRLDPASFDQPNSIAEHPSTPRWIFHHLGQHEAEHRGQIQSILTALRAQ